MSKHPSTESPVSGVIESAVGLVAAVWLLFLLGVGVSGFFL